MKPRSLADQLRDYWRVAEELERVKDRNTVIEGEFMRVLLVNGELQDELDRLRRMVARERRA